MNKEDIATVEIVDEKIEVDLVEPDDKKPAMMPRVMSPVMGYNEVKARGRGSFNPPEYNLFEIGRVIDTDSYAREAFAKKVALMFKEGWDITGPNPRTVKYIKSRLSQIANATDVPTEKLLRDIGTSLIQKSNSFLLKVRKASASGGKVRTEPGKNTSIQPIAGYFTIPAETVQVQKDGNKIIKWRQRVPSSDEVYKDFMPRDIVHFYANKKDGFTFGTPTITPVIDDIRSLRKIEENIELLVYQHLFPIFQYVVGTPEMPAGYTETGEREVDVVRREIQYMPTEGGIVTPERHSIKAIGAEGRALRAESYLDHFKKRVFSGLGISSVDMGEAETSNKSTADNMSRNLIDGVKDYQRIIEIFFNHFIIKELLLESTFGFSVLDEENLVYLKFKEIDIDAQIKKENHHADLFAKNTVTHDEARIAIGKEPIPIPDPEEVQNREDTYRKYPAWNRMQWKMFQLPTLLIQSLDEPWSPLAEAVAADNSIDVTSSDIEQARRKSDERESAALKSKESNRSTNKDFVVLDSVVESTFLEVKSSVLNYISFNNSLDEDWVSSIVRTEMSTIIDSLTSFQMTNFRNGYSTESSVLTQDFIRKASTARSHFKSRSNKYINKLTEDIIKKIRRNDNKNQLKDSLMQNIRLIFDTLQYRAKFIESVEIKKAYNYGKSLALKDKGAKRVDISGSTNGCANCTSHIKDGVDLTYLTIEDLPPYHANCDCAIDTTNMIFDSFKDSGNIQDRTKSTRTENKTYRYTRCVQRTKARLFQDHPDWSDSRLESAAEIACEMLRDSKTKEDIDLSLFGINESELEDVASEEECIMSVKKSLKTQNPGWSSDKIKSSAFAICRSRKK